MGEQMLANLGGFLVSTGDALLLEIDRALYGDVYLKATGEFEDGEPIYKRVDPTSIFPATSTPEEKE